MNPKQKGSRGERELAGILRGFGYESHRNDQMYKGGKDNPDVSLAGMHVECKRVEALRLYDALEQAQSDSGGKVLPCVMHRKNNAPWVCVMFLEDWINLYREWEAGKI